MRFSRKRGANDNRGIPVDEIRATFGLLSNTMQPAISLPSAERVSMMPRCGAFHSGLTAEVAQDGMDWQGGARTARALAVTEMQQGPGEFPTTQWGLFSGRAARGPSQCILLVMDRLASHVGRLAVACALPYA